MAEDILETHAQEFTDIERSVLRIWFDVDQAGNDDLADRVLNTGLQLEHYTANLPHDPMQRNAAQLAKQQLLAFRLAEQVAQANQFLAGKNTKGQGRASQFLDTLPRIGVTEEQFDARP